MSWFRKMRRNGPDYSAVTSREKAVLLAKDGELVPMLLLPELFRGDANPANIVFVPPFVAELKNDTDEHVVRPLAADGKVTRYTAEPSYSGKSFVPIMVTVRAHDPGDFTQEIRVWGESLAE